MPKYPFCVMQLGDQWVSRFAPALISSAAGNYGRRHKMKFSVKQYIENGKKQGCIVTRVE